MSETALALPQPSNIHLVARNPNEMALAKTSLELFLSQKIAQCDSEADDLFRAYEEAVKHKWKSSTFRTHGNLAKRRGDFYRKVKAAVEAGYTIVPNFPIDIFAVRVKRQTPRSDTAESTWNQSSAISNAKDIIADSIPSGEGRYVSNLPAGITGNYNKELKDGKQEKRYFFEVTEFQDVAFPIEAARVEVMSATAEAMALKVFDQVGICPQTRKGDPLLIGKVLGPKVGYTQKEVSFLIAWHLDLRTL